MRSLREQEEHIVLRAWLYRVAICGSLVACLLTLATAAAQEQVLSLEQLTKLDWPQLEELYRQAEPGTVPEGYLRGRAIYGPDSKFAGTRSKVTHLLWHGKHFDSADSTLINQWCGFRAIRAKVCYGPSWLDDRPSIIMDYHETSRVWVDVRDEVREVAPGLYLGRMYRRKPCGPEFQFFFALEACHP
jgi:hypothetical protein